MTASAATPTASSAFTPGAILRPLIIPGLALLTALVVGALVIVLAGDDVLAAYEGLFLGAFGSARAWSTVARNLTPLLLTGLSVAVAFKAGLFNIGAAGQYLMGAISAVAVGINFPDLPVFVHLPLAMLAGIGGGLIWGAIPGALKAYTGAHEVITTIMLNYVAANFVGWTVSTDGPLRDPTSGAISETPDVLMSARIPFIFDRPYNVHWGIPLAILVAVFVWWLIYKTTLGFEIRTVGQNVKAARYAGIRVNWTIILTMSIAGALAGLAGAIETLGLIHRFAPEFGGGVGFDGITVALLGQTNPLGIILVSPGRAGRGRGANAV